MILCVYFKILHFFFIAFNFMHSILFLILCSYAAFICVTKLNRLYTNNKISQLAHSLACYMMPGDSLLTHDMNVFEPYGVVLVILQLLYMQLRPMGYTV